MAQWLLRKTRNDVYETLCPKRMLLQMVAKLAKLITLSRCHTYKMPMLKYTKNIAGIVYLKKRGGFCQWSDFKLL